jgi:serine/threonine protein phosphatase PrpC
MAITEITNVCRWCLYTTGKTTISRRRIRGMICWFFFTYKLMASFNSSQIRHFLAPSKGDCAETHFFGLFDGHAGGKCSQYVSSNLPNALAEDDFFANNLPQAIKRSFYSINESFLKIAEKMKLHDGSTGLCAIVRDNKLLIANVGDCRALLMSNGRPVQLSTDHKPTSPDEQKRIAALGGSVVYCMGVARVNRVLAVSRAFGNRTIRSVIRPDADLTQRDLTDGDDFLVLASDGLWDVLKNKDVCDVCYSPFLQRKPQAIADELVQLALARGSMDNVTCVVVGLHEFKTRNATATISASSASFPRPLTSQQQLHQQQQQQHRQYQQQNSSSSDEDSGIGGLNNKLQDVSIISNHDDNDMARTAADLSAHFNNPNNSNNGRSLTSSSGMKKGYPLKVNSHEVPPKQFSLGNGLNDNNNVVGDSSNENSKKPTPQVRMPFVKATSMNSIPSLLDLQQNQQHPSGPSFPSVNTMLNDNFSGKLFSAATSGMDSAFQRQLNARTPSRSSNQDSSSSGIIASKGNVAGSLRNTVVGSRGGHRSHGSENIPVSRASLNDLSTMIHEFNGNSSY